MSAPLRVLYAAPECAPLTKTGGLGDVAGALPAALRGLGIDARLLLPGYREVLQRIGSSRTLARLAATAHFPAAELLGAAHPNGTPLLVLACAELFDRDGGPYLDPTGRDWPDNALRFGLLSHVAALLAGAGSPIDWHCDVLHCNDWQTGLAPAYLHWRGERASASVFTIHNLAYQGIFPRATLTALGLPAAAFAMHGVEFHGSVSFMKAGLYHASRLTTVSPTYAREIQSEPLGFGLHGLLATRADDVVGILNGIDQAVWNPADDPHLAARYDAATLARKSRNSVALRSRCGLAPRPDLPLLGVVSRLIPQKGIDLVAAAAERLLTLPAQLLILGTGDAAIEAALAAIARRHPDAFAFVNGFDEALSHLLEAGSDLFLMPSRFEPCGLNQMYSQRYGTPPVVRRTGGLADSVVDCSEQTLRSGEASGFVFDDATPAALIETVERALALWRQTRSWRKLQRSAMSRDFGWAASAARYRALYETVVAEQQARA